MRDEDKIANITNDNEPTSGDISDSWYVNDNSDEMTVIDRLKPNDKINYEYFINMEYTKNKIVDLLKNMPKKVTKSAIIMIQDKNR
ncbi:hypothetical protein [Brachyspira hampsonii]|uniref:RNA polymerase sigma 28 subunit FliA/WhiG n=1 Tax=Brachyspira hampsonii 30446 TaxID=1289135 RepID=A0A2U4EYE1_9SPIR|nr:hypothetical protein [Brachyspira hampsonii]EKV56482.1 RNA polymerase sigma 28 subunit FliA/WhiG [Brachyspira hampsonii 30446]MBW5388603.1 hypothetical protein [Brachyspira hampsonii]MBW5394129.1 hypothetical protein [Brachyspira hampsonii]OEJ20333.1 hypothetical protein A9495_01875 [Brachyspira hampsonii]